MKNFISVFILFILFNGFSQEKYLGDGPFDQLIIRGVTLINGDGSPPRGPVDIVVENNIIMNIKSVGYPGVDIKDSSRPKLKKGGFELSADGMYLLPGFIDMHGHIGGNGQGADYDYVFRLWMAHGITTVREPGGRGIDWALNLKKLSSENKPSLQPKSIND